MEPASELLQRTFLSNTVEAYLWAAGILLAGLIFKKIFSVLLTKLVYLLFRKYSSGVKGGNLYAAVDPAGIPFYHADHCIPGMQQAAVPAGVEHGSG
jgi:hypothetical protein